MKPFKTSNGGRAAPGRKTGSVALLVDKHVCGGNECQLIRRDGFVLPMHKKVGKRLLIADLHHELNFANHMHQLDDGQDTFGRSKCLEGQHR
jgi:hypothetical protein